MTRSPLPPLIVQSPLCPLCQNPTFCDGDSFRCTPCRATWASASYDQDGEADDDLPQCTAEVMPFADDPRVKFIAAYRYRCVCNAGHVADDHIGVEVNNADRSAEPTFTWSDGEYPDLSAAQTSLADAAEVPA